MRPPSREAGQPDEIEWSPDGAYLAIVNDLEPGGGRLYVMDADGSGVRILVDNFEPGVGDRSSGPHDRPMRPGSPTRTSQDHMSGSCGSGLCPSTARPHPWSRRTPSPDVASIAAPPCGPPTARRSPSRPITATRRRGRVDVTTQPDGAYHWKVGDRDPSRRHRQSR